MVHGLEVIVRQNEEASRLRGDDGSVNAEQVIAEKAIDLYRSMKIMRSMVVSGFVVIGGERVRVHIQKTSIE